MNDDGRIGVAAAVGLLGLLGLGRTLTGSSGRLSPRFAIVARPSPIHGQGAFAAEPIPTRAVLGPGLVRTGHTGTGEADFEQSALTQLLNHRPPANVTFARTERGSDRRFHIVTLRPISFGEELVADYTALRQIVFGDAAGKLVYEPLLDAFVEAAV